MSSPPVSRPPPGESPTNPAPRPEPLENKAMALRIDTEVILRQHSFRKKGGDGLKAAIAGGRAVGVGINIVMSCTQGLSANTLLGGLSGWRCHKGLFNAAVLTVAVVPQELLQAGWTAAKIALTLEPAAQHPNILRMLAWCDHAEDRYASGSKKTPLHCIIFEGCKGVTLKDRDRIKSWEDRMTLAGSVSSALLHLSVYFPNGVDGYLKSSDLMAEERGTAKISGTSLIPLLRGARTPSPQTEDTARSTFSSTRSSEDLHEPPTPDPWPSFLPSILKPSAKPINFLTQSAPRHWYLRTLGLITLELIVARPLDPLKDQELIEDFLACPEEECGRYFTKVHGEVPQVVSRKLFSIANRCLRGKGDIAQVFVVRGEREKKEKKILQAHDRCTRLRQRYAKAKERGEVGC